MGGARARTAGPTGRRVLLPVRPQHELYRWQAEAIAAWLRCGRRGVIEAVTGSGKTDVAIAVIGDALRRRKFVLVVVPSRVLLEQWHRRLTHALPEMRIGRLGDTAHDDPAECDVLVATRHSAAALRPVPPDDREGGLLVVDECHGLGGGVLRQALLTAYDERMGLTATLERSDDAVTDLLLPYFGGICHRYGFVDAIADGVCAPPRVAFVGVSLTAEERAEYLATEQQLVTARAHLRRIPSMPNEPFGAFVAAVAHLADRDSGPDGRAARDYLDAFAKRRQIVAQSSEKYALLGRFSGAIKRADGALIFTETVRAANHAVNRLDPEVAIDVITGSTARRQRKEILDDLRARRLDVVAAPRVLDEGIDVPDANLGIVLSASRTRRQMIQRMGRILRRKRPGVAAHFVIVFAKDTLEDPAMRVERDGFLDEIEAIASALGVFDVAELDALDAFLDAPGPEAVPEPQRARRAVALDASMDAAARYAHLAFVARVPAEEFDAAFAELPAFIDPTGGAGDTGRVDPASAEGDSLPYLDPELSLLPEIERPKQEPKRFSTGQAPLALEAVDGGWQMACTGCGETTEPVQFRWQALDLTVRCRCA